MKTLIVLLLAITVSAHAALRTWTGSGANTNWTTAANWSGNVAPVAGDTLEFPVVGTTFNSVNNFPAGTSFGDILIGAATYNITGNAITLNGDLLYNFTGISQFSCPLQFTVAHTIQGDGNLDIGSVDVSGPSLSMNPTSGVLVVSGTITGTGALTKLGNGRLNLTQDNSGFSGNLHIDAGEMDVYHSKALDGAREVVFSSATLGLFGATPLNIQRSLIFNGGCSLFAGDSAHTISGDVEFNTISNLSVQTVGAGSPSINFAGSVSGSGDLQLIGTGIFSGSGNNTFSGLLRVSGNATLNKTNGSVCAPNGVLITSSSSCILSADDQINGLLTLQAGATMTFNDHNLAVTSLSIADGTLDTGNGTLNISGGVSHAGGNATINGTLNCTAASQAWSIGSVSTETLTVNASVSFPTGATMIRSGIGKLVLNSGTGLATLTNQQGVTILNGANPSLNVSVQSGTLGGSGSVGAVTQSSSLASRYAPGGGIGALTVDRFSWNSFSTVDIELNGVAQGSGYDAIITTGSVTSQFSSAALNVTLGSSFAAPVNAKFRIIDVRGTAGSPGGTFSGKANNSTFVVGAYTFRINYFTGTGNNDVELTVTAGPFTTTARTWTGAGANALWSNAANWSGGVAPNPGDNLVFPASSSQFTTTNDFTAGTYFNAITTLGSYTHSGTAVTVTSMTSSPGAAGSTTSSFDIALSAGSPALNCGNGFWSNAGHVTGDAGALTISVSTGATMQVAGVISGSDAISKTGSGILALSNANDFTGEFTLNAGTLSLSSGSALGSVVAGTRLLSGSCTINGPLSISEPLELNAACALTLSGGSSTLSGTLTTSGSVGQTCFITIGGGVLAVFTGAISGTVGITLSGGGSALINGSNGNTFADKLTVDLPLTLSKSGSNADAVPFGTQLVMENNRVVTLGASNQIAGSVRLKAGATLNLNGNNEALNTLDMEGGTTVHTGAGTLTLAGTLHAYNAASTINGKLDFAGTCTLTVDDSGSPDDLTINAVISSASLPNLTRNGAGRVVLTGNNSLTTMRLDAGDTAITGTNSALAIDLHGGTLSGTGSVVSITASTGGVIAPGMPSGNGAGILTAGSLNLNAATILQMDVQGSTPGTGHDQIVTTTNANLLGNAVLQLTIGFTPALNTEFKLISNTSLTTATNSGTLSELAEGIELALGATVYRINYNAGSNNNDVLLTRITPSAPRMTSSSITSVGGGNNNVTMAGTGVLFGAYQFQESTDLINWTTVATTNASGSGAWNFNVVRSAGVLGRLFYRTAMP